VMAVTATLAVTTIDEEETEEEIVVISTRKDITVLDIETIGIK
jgi:hypothetical protein